MHKLVTFLLLGSLGMWGQSTQVPRQPQIVDSSYLSRMGAVAKYGSINKVTPDGNAATKQQRVNSVPNFTSSFTFNGNTFPFTMAGKDPQKGNTANLETSIMTIQFLFDEFVDQNGNNIVLDAATALPLIVNGPNFQNAPYGTGTTQFSDAVQRAEFFNVMKPDWHTLLEKPRTLQPVQIEVPFGASVVFQAGAGGPFFALVDGRFFLSQLNTILQFEPLHVNEL